MSWARQRRRIAPAGHGAGRMRRWWRDFKWSTLLWSLVFPARRERIVLTLPGLLLIALSLGIGSAAYNTANNILFIALSLLLSCLILSGVLSWLNFSGVRWRSSRQGRRCARAMRRGGGTGAAQREKIPADPMGCGLSCG